MRDHEEQASVVHDPPHVQSSEALVARRERVEADAQEHGFLRGCAFAHRLHGVFARRVSSSAASSSSAPSAAADSFDPGRGHGVRLQAARLSLGSRTSSPRGAPGRRAVREPAHVRGGEPLLEPLPRRAHAFRGAPSPWRGAPPRFPPRRTTLGPSSAATRPRGAYPRSRTRSRSRSSSGGIGAAVSSSWSASVRARRSEHRARGEVGRMPPEAEPRSTCTCEDSMYATSAQERDGDEGNAT